MNDSHTSLRHLAVPERVVSNRVIVARPLDGEPLLLDATASIVWMMLDDWSTPGQVEATLSLRYSDIAPAARREALELTLQLLSDEGLLERAES